MMDKAQKLLNILMGDGVSDGEIINARNILKKMNVKLSIGDNSQSDTYINLFNKHYNLQKEYQNLYRNYEKLYKQKEEVIDVLKPTYTKLNNELKKKLIDKDIEINSWRNRLYYLIAIEIIICVVALLLGVEVRI